VRKRISPLHMSACATSPCGWNVRRKKTDTDRAGTTREFAQLLTGLKLDLASVGKQLAKGVATSQSIGSQGRLLLRPSILDDLGLVPALQWQAREFEARAGFPCETKLCQNLSSRDLDPDRSTALFRIAQELLTNVMRHGSEWPYVSNRMGCFWKCPTTAAASPNGNT
jgi:hypothetical protein